MNEVAAMLCFSSTGLFASEAPQRVVAGTTGVPYLCWYSAAGADPPAVYVLLFLLSSGFAAFPQPFRLALHLRQKA